MNYLHALPTLLDYGYADTLVLAPLQTLAFPLVGLGVSPLRVQQIAAQCCRKQDEERKSAVAMVEGVIVGLQAEERITKEG